MKRLFVLLAALMLAGTCQAQFTLSTKTFGTTASGQSMPSPSFTVPSGSNLVLVSAFEYKTSGCSSYSPTLTSVTDNHSNTYTLKPVFSDTGTCTGIWIAYMVNAPSGSTVVTANTFDAGSTPYAILVTVYSVSGGTATYDQTAQAQTASGATPIVLPSITPAHTGSLLYSTAIVNTYTNGTASPWTLGNNFVGNIVDAYILSSSSGSTTPYLTDPTNPDAYNSIVTAFYIASSGGGSPVAPVQCVIF